MTADKEAKNVKKRLKEIRETVEQAELHGSEFDDVKRKALEAQRKLDLLDLERAYAEAEDFRQEFFIVKAQAAGLSGRTDTDTLLDRVAAIADTLDRLCEEAKNILGSEVPEFPPADAELPEDEKKYQEILRWMLRVTHNGRIVEDGINPGRFLYKPPGSIAPYPWREIFIRYFNDQYAKRKVKKRDQRSEAMTLLEDVGREKTERLVNEWRTRKIEEQNGDVEPYIPAGEPEALVSASSPIRADDLVLSSETAAPTPETPPEAVAPVLPPALEVQPSNEAQRQSVSDWCDDLFQSRGVQFTVRTDADGNNLFFYIPFSASHDQPVEVTPEVMDRLFTALERLHADEFASVGGEQAVRSLIDEWWEKKKLQIQNDAMVLVRPVTPAPETELNAQEDDKIGEFAENLQQENEQLREQAAPVAKKLGIRGSLATFAQRIARNAALALGLLAGASIGAGVYLSGKTRTPAAIHAASEPSRKAPVRSATQSEEPPPQLIIMHPEKSPEPAPPAPVEAPAPTPSSAPEGQVDFEEDEVLSFSSDNAPNLKANSVSGQFIEQIKKNRRGAEKWAKKYHLKNLPADASPEDVDAWEKQLAGEIAREFGYYDRAKSKQLKMTKQGPKFVLDFNGKSVEEIGVEREGEDANVEEVPIPPSSSKSRAPKEKAPAAAPVASPAPEESAPSASPDAIVDELPDSVPAARPVDIRPTQTTTVATERTAPASAVADAGGQNGFELVAPAAFEKASQYVRAVRSLMNAVERVNVMNDAVAVKTRKDLLQKLNDHRDRVYREAQRHPTEGDTAYLRDLNEVFKRTLTPEEQLLLDPRFEPYITVHGARAVIARDANGNAYYLPYKEPFLSVYGNVKKGMLITQNLSDQYLLQVVWKNHRPHLEVSPVKRWKDVP